MKTQKQAGMQLSAYHVQGQVQSPVPHTWCEPQDVNKLAVVTHARSWNVWMAGNLSLSLCNIVATEIYLKKHFFKKVWT